MLYSILLFNGLVLYVLMAINILEIYKKLKNFFNGYIGASLVA